MSASTKSERRPTKLAVRVKHVKVGPTKYAVRVTKGKQRASRKQRRDDRVKEE